ncbi:hypothetical protein K6K41_15625 [Chenggangzhangella methanolivorans]|uniref:Peptidase S8/S53 domain-containing protein n=1 Tax=Chenggangzhangella methanolivorans TaxID=1437009 RepID=A0A9E6UL18_9HYPH|nr:hypothetical protein [Chenggangzhangella methanolivorans]QZN98485.1 hypothetical protein K6K41_15625 [Chenggangzhangella methanolivorans]
MKLHATLGAMALAVIAAGPGVAAELAPRAPVAKQSYQSMRAMGASDRVTVKFREGRRLRVQSAGLSGLSSGEASALKAALATLGVSDANLKRLHSLPEATLDSQRAEAEAESGRQMADLNLYFTLSLPAGSDAAAVADRLNALPFVEFAAPAPVPRAAAGRHRAQDAEILQGPGLPQEQQARRRRAVVEEVSGRRGRGNPVVDLEYSWRLDHEDLEIPADRVITGGDTPRDPFNDANHGTAVLGEIVGKDNKYGVTGIAPKATAYVAPANTVESNYSPSRAIVAAGGTLRRGDVLIIEQTILGLRLPDEPEPLRAAGDAPGGVRRRLDADCARRDRAGGRGQRRGQSRRAGMRRPIRPERARLRRHHRRSRLLHGPLAAVVLELRLARRRAGLGAERRHHRMAICSTLQTSGSATPCASAGPRARRRSSREPRSRSRACASPASSIRSARARCARR